MPLLHLHPYSLVKCSDLIEHFTHPLCSW